VALTLAGCSLATSDRFDRHLVGPYYLVAADVPEQLNVTYQGSGGMGWGRIGPVVIDAGWDERYIVATCRDVEDRGGELSYYYLDIAKDPGGMYFDGAATGPLTREEFAAAKDALGLPEFTLHYPELR
jgi:hypothetical protein